MFPTIGVLPLTGFRLSNSKGSLVVEGIFWGLGLKGSWDLVTRVINKVPILITTYDPK